MSVVSSFLHKAAHNPIVHGLGHVIDAGSNFLPGPLGAVGHVAGGLLENKNLKSSLIGAGESMLGGKIAGMLGKQFGVHLPGGGETFSGAPGNTPAGAMSFSGGIAGGMPVMLPNQSHSGGIMGALKGGIGSLIGNHQGGQQGTSALDWAKLGIDTLGGIAGGVQNAQNQKTQQKDWERQQGQSEGQDAFKYQQSTNSAPLRDQAQYLLMQRMGMVPQAFRPHDIFNESYGSGPAQLGGIDNQALQTANNAYQPGMGGVKTDVEKALMARYGFAPQAQKAH